MDGGGDEERRLELIMYDELVRNEFGINRHLKYWVPIAAPEQTSHGFTNCEKL